MDEIPERGNVIRPAVSLVDIISVLPDIAGEQRFVWPGQWRGGIRRIHDVHRAIGFLHQPGPSGPEISNCALRERFLEGAEGSEFAADRFRERSRGFAVSARRQTVPVKCMVPDLCGIVEDTAGRFADDLLEAGVADAALVDFLIRCE